MRIRCKKGVYIKFIDDRFLDMIRVVAWVYRSDKVVPVLTSACDGSHSRNSLHSQGLAWDWRIWGLEDVQKTAQEIRKTLQIIDPRYDVVYGDSKHLDHIHIEYDINKKL